MCEVFGYTNKQNSVRSKFRFLKCHKHTVGAWLVFTNASHEKGSQNFHNVRQICWLDLMQCAENANLTCDFSWDNVALEAKKKVPNRSRQIPLLHYLNNPRNPPRSGFCIKCECVNLVLTPSQLTLWARAAGICISITTRLSAWRYVLN